MQARRFYGILKEALRAKTYIVSVTGDRGLCSLQAVRIPENHSFLRYQAIKVCIDDVSGADSSEFYNEKVRKFNFTWFSGEIDLSEHTLHFAVAIKQ